MQNARWWAEGDLIEGCNCELLCPCHISFKQKMSYPTCEAVWAAHIEQGELGPVSLNGLNTLIVVHCPGPTMFEGNWTALLYIDEKATSEQEQALVAIFSGAAGGPWARMAPFLASGQIMAIQRAPFEYAKERRSRALRVPDRASLELQAIRGMDREAEVKLTNLFNVIHGPEHVLAHSTHHVRDQGLIWNNSGKHGLYSTFSWASP